MSTPARDSLLYDKYWTIGQFPLFDYATDQRLLDVPPGVIAGADVMGEKWAAITYSGKYGYCNRAYLEQYEQAYQQNVVTIENQLCICSIVGDSMGTLSAKYEMKSPSWWRRIVLKDSTTSLDDLVHILVNVYGHATPVRLQAALTDGAGMRFTPGRIAAICKDKAVIVGVRIAYDGYLARSGVAHWVVVRSVLPNGVDGGRVEIYNPFTNAIEWYSWREFKAAVGTPAGICVNNALE
jgi:hypothetical protein